MKTKPLLAALMAGVLFASSPFLAERAGAAAVNLGVGAYYLRGELKSTESASMEAVLMATEMGLDNLRIEIVSSEYDDLSARLEVRVTPEMTGTIRMRKMTGNFTEVRIRIGSFGDESISRQIHALMQANLAEAQKVV